MHNNKKKLRTTIFLSNALAKQAKAQAIIEELTLTELVEKALLRYLPQETIIRKVDLNVAVDRQSK